MQLQAQTQQATPVAPATPVDPVQAPDGPLAPYAQLPAETLRLALQAVAWAVRRDDASPTPFAAQLLAAIQAQLGTQFEQVDQFDRVDQAQLAPGPQPIAAELTQLSETHRTTLLRLMIVAAMFDGRPTPDQLGRLQSAATQLAVEEPELEAVAAFTKGKGIRTRRLLLRKVWFAPKLAARARKVGRLRAYGAFVLASIFRVYHNRKIAARYKPLRQLPEGTLGRAFVAYLDDNGFPMPGTRGAVSDLIVYHDLCHVLSGYGTTPTQEPLVATFMAGFSQHHPFGLIILAMLQFHLDMRIAPVAPGEYRLIDPAAALQALLRGMAVPVDIIGDWDYWPLMSRPLAEVRQALNVPPLAI